MAKKKWRIEKAREARQGVSRRGFPGRGPDWRGSGHIGIRHSPAWAKRHPLPKPRAGGRRARKSPHHPASMARTVVSKSNRERPLAEALRFELGLRHKWSAIWLCAALHVWLDNSGLSHA